MQCHGWLITTADTCTQCDCIPDAGISPLHLTQLTEHCGLNKIMQDGFFRNFEEAIRSSSVCGLVFVVSVWGGFCLLLPVFGGFWWLSFPWVSPPFWRFSWAFFLGFLSLFGGFRAPFGRFFGDP